MINTNNIDFIQISPFDMKVSYVETDSLSYENQFDSHIHTECEIYINITGDVSFMVEGHIYPIKSGDIIITRPYEYHHCIYNSHTLHKHFWILLKSDNNEELLKIFFNRKIGTNNLLSLEDSKKAKLLEHCSKMLVPDKSLTERYLDFFKLLSFIEDAKELYDTEKNYHKDTLYAIKYINRNCHSKISVSKIAQDAHVSINTLERHFQENIKMSPSAYLKRIRLAKAAKLLASDISVCEAAEMCGFCDYSTFIAEFKKFYKMTPLKYKKDRTD